MANLIKMPDHWMTIGIVILSEPNLSDKVVVRINRGMTYATEALSRK